MKETKTSNNAALAPAVRAYLADIGKRGGSVTSDTKAAAVRENGKRGGRPSQGLAARRRAIRDYIREHGGLRGLSPAAKSELLRDAERSIDNAQ